MSDESNVESNPDLQEQWKVSFGALNVGVIEIGDERGNIVVAVHFMMRRYSGEKGNDLAWKTANCIAAAPDILLAAQETLMALGMHGGTLEAKDPSLVKMRTAIAKAEGKLNG